MRCELCGKVLIDYTLHNDWEYDYDGDKKDIYEYYKKWIEMKKEGLSDDEILEDLKYRLTAQKYNL